LALIPSLWETTLPNQRRYRAKQDANSRLQIFNRRTRIPARPFSSEGTKTAFLVWEFGLVISPGFCNLKIVEKSVAKSGGRS
jgi:hypothetical protein